MITQAPAYSSTDALNEMLTRLAAEQDLECGMLAVPGEAVEQVRVGEVVEPARPERFAKPGGGKLVRGESSHTASVPCSR